MRTPQKILVVGGGLAGIAAATALAQHSSRPAVTLLEARHALGGRASSFDDPESTTPEKAELLDNCQHVLLGCCTNLLDLYRRIGVQHKIHFDPRVHFLDENGGRHDLWALPALPAPLHLGPAMGLFSALRLHERTAVVRAMLAMLRMGRSGRDKLEATSFGDWLRTHRQPESVITKFYDPIVVSALNEETRRASAKYAIQVFQEAMLAHRAGYVVGLPACPLGELYDHLPPEVTVRTSTRVDQILFDTTTNPPRATGIRLRGGEELHADALILATNYHAVLRWIADLPAEARTADTRFSGLAKLENVPILGAHMWYDRPLMPHMSAAALIKGPLQWLFRKDAAGKILHGVISAARAWPTVPKDEALRQFHEQLQQLFPAAREAKLLRGVIVIEKRATFSPLPGTDQFRPPQSPSAQGIQNLHLAGDYTQTGWPATMEGAVRSGYLAAESVLKQLQQNTTPRILTPDLPTQWPARLMGLSK